MSERALQVGDLCVGQGFRVHVESNGMQCVVTELVTNMHTYRFGDPDKQTNRFLEFGYRVRWEDGSVTSQAREDLRRIPPKSEPKLDFVPAEEDFTLWLKQVGRVRA